MSKPSIRPGSRLTSRNVTDQDRFREFLCFQARIDPGSGHLISLNSGYFDMATRIFVLIEAVEKLEARIEELEKGQT